MRTRSILLSAALVAMSACGAPASEKPSPQDTEPTNSTTVVDPNNSVIESNNETTPTVDPKLPAEPVEVDCVSDLVTHNGNYYALSALISDSGADIELVRYLAATPTSDPEETAIWTAVVDLIEFTPLVFAFETEEQFLDVARSEEDGVYRGTMSGETEFEGAVQVSCWPTDLEHAAAYDPTSGTCVDELGNAAWNQIPWMVAVRTGFGQCARFEGELTGEAFGYPTFDFIDLRGADFNNAALHFADLQDVQLEGADLRQFDFGYSTIAGSIDEHTQLPELAECDVPDGATSFECTR